MATRWRALHKKRKRFSERKHRPGVVVYLEGWPRVRSYLTEGKYILDGKTAVPCYDLIKWAQWFETADRHVADDDINGVRISTVFLGMDHNHMRHFFGGNPVLFESMVFGGPLNGHQERYCTWEEAELGHATIKAQVLELEKWPEEV